MVRRRFPGVAIVVVGRSVGPALASLWAGIQGKGELKMVRKHTQVALVIGSALLFAGCVPKTTQLEGYEGSATPPGAQMTAGEAAGAPAMVYRSPSANLTKYTKFWFPPADIYSGSDAEFDGASPQEKQKMAQYMQTQFSKVVGEKYAIVNSPGPGVAKVQLTLAGMKNNVPIVSPVAHLAPVGLAVNLIKQAADKPAIATGYVTIAVTVFDSQSNDILVSAIQNRAPDAMDIPASFSSTDAQEAAINQAAKAFRNRIDQIQSKAAGA